MDIRSTIYNPLAQDPTTIFPDFPSNTSIPEVNNTSFDPTKAFKNIVSDIIEALPFLISHFSYEPKTIVLQLESLKQELNNASATYKSAMPHPNKNLLPAIDAPLKILIGQLQYHHIHSSTALNIN